MQNRRVSEKNRMVALLLAIFLGIFGVHRFYAGRIASGLLYLFTEGLFGIGVIIDIILIATGSFYDDRGLPILNWEDTPRPIDTTTMHSHQSTQSAQKVQYQTDEPIIYCPDCGSINESETVYCSTCGLPLKR